MDKSKYIRLVNWLSNKYGLNPYDLDALINSESARNPNAQATTASAYGLFQMIETNRIRFAGTKYTPLSLQQQFNAIDRYFAYYKLPFGADAGVLYAVLFLPARVNRFKLATAGETYYELNKGLDSPVKGYITTRDLAARINRKKDGKIDFGIIGSLLKFRHFIFNPDI